MKVTLDGPDGWARGRINNGNRVPVRVRHQQGGGGVLLWAGIINDELVGRFQVEDGLKINSKTYCQFLEDTFFKQWYRKRNIVTMPTIKLQSSDGEMFEVDVEIAKQSVTIKTMLEDLGMDDEGDDDPVPLPNVNAAILKKVIQWCTHHKDDPPPPEDDENKEKRTDDIPVWDQEFLKVDQGTLFELILAANYLDIKGLLDVTCKTVANMIKGKTPEEIRKTFNIKNDFTEEEEAQVRKENQWCEEK
ncbi:hypothetical protein PGIGA_G00066450 [Pangasianodon gigas]|uniref:Uncharacterized protein n=1 Tax=Pangasianodon gigas TaxID=30993 RepID=A0ACC5X668_PANGG|nr:hypothetical protein [Pangasianodon gigas]